MTDKLLKEKHWKIFLITFGLQVVVQFMLIQYFFKLNDIRIFIFTVPVLFIVSFSGYFLYLWSTAVGLQRLRTNKLTLKVNRFKILFYYLVIYLCAFSFIGVIAFTGLFNDYFAVNGGIIFGPHMIFLPIHLFSTVSYFYCLAFIAKSIVTVRNNDKASFSEILWIFILLCFFPIGIWIIQPKINVIIA